MTLRRIIHAFRRLSVTEFGVSLQQASRDARAKVKDLQSEAVSDLKAAHAKDMEAHSLAKAARGLQH